MFVAYQRHKNKGVALITALLVTSIATITAVALASRQHLDVRRTANVLESEQAYVYALGLETVAQKLLTQYTLTSNKYDDPSILYVPYTFPVEGGTIAGNLVDMEALFNINNLLDDNDEPEEKQKARFRRLIESVQADIGDNGASAEDLVNATIDWIDKNTNMTFPGGAEDGEYLALDKSYRPANHFMANATELALVQGFTNDLLYGIVPETNDPNQAEEPIKGLLSYVSALPRRKTAINVNTADDKILVAFSQHITSSMLSNLNADSPYESLDAFRNHSAFDSLNLNEKKELKQDIKNGMAVESRYFKILATAQIGNSYAQLNTLLYRNLQGGTKVMTVSRAQGIMGFKYAGKYNIPSQ